MGNVQQHIGKRTTIGRYEVEIVKYLGEGGSSFIFLVKDVVSANAKPMVLKRLLAENEKTLAWIHSEIHMHQRFRHPQIVEFIASQTNRAKGSEREVFILMEYCPSGHLHENMMKMGEKRFTERELLRVFRQLCVPVSVLHRQDPPIAHRDLKLENFLLTDTGVYKLCDFGSCVEGPQSLKTKDDRMRELENVDKRTTAMYRSPELADVEGTAMFGTGELTEAVDVWAMGCVLYTMAFFKPPFPPDGLRTERYTIPEGSKYSPSVLALIKRMLTGDVEMRATLDHVIECIDELMEGRALPPWRGVAASGAAKKPAAVAAGASAGTSAAKTRDSLSGATTAATASAPATKKTTEARKETVPVSKPAMDLLDMDFNPSISSGAKPSSTAPDAWNAAPPVDGFASFATFPSPTSMDGKRMDAFGFPASPVKQQQAPAAPTFGFTAAAAPTPAPVHMDPFAELAPAMGHAMPAPMMGGGGAPGFTQALHHQASPLQQPQQFYGHQPQGFYPQQQQRPPQQGMYQPQAHHFQQQPQQQQQMWGAQPQQQQQQQQQQAFGGANAFNATRF